MRPTTPRLNVPHDVGPTSPPQTPTTASPVINRKASSKQGGGFPPQKIKSKYPMSQHSNILPLGNGHSFSYTRPIRPEDLSPRSSSSSSADSEAVSSESGSPPRSMSSGPTGRPDIPSPQFVQRIRTIITPTASALSIEECSDFDDSDDDRLDVIRPHAIEDAESERSRSRSRNRPELDPRVVHDFRGLNCDTESDASDMDQDEFQEMLRRARAERRRKRMTSGSIGKRTISESIGSDTDREDLQQFLDMNDLGSSARRLRRRVGERWSLQFQDPPPRIDEIEEHEELDGESLARELPYYNYVSMEIDSP